MNLTWLGAPACGSDGTAWRAEWQKFECEVIDLVNQRRAAGATCGSRRMSPAPPLARQQQLTNSARSHAEDMAKRNYFDHFSPEHKSPFERMQAAGYTGTTMGENISEGQPTAKMVVDDWMQSEHHCDNIMSPAFTQLGVGYYYTPSGKYKHYWVQNFGSGGAVEAVPTAPPAPPPTPPPRRAPVLHEPPKRPIPSSEQVENQRLPSSPPPQLQQTAPAPTSLPRQAVATGPSSVGLFVLGGAIAAGVVWVLLA
jgi:uncharacterized protein YkwD